MRNEALRFDTLRDLADSVSTRRPSLVFPVKPALWAGAAYYVGCLAGFGLRYPGSGISFFWPPTAVLTAILVVAPTRWWPAFLTSALVAHAIAHTGNHIAALEWLVMFVGNSLQALIGASIVTRYAGGLDAFTNARRMLIFVVACWLAPAIASTMPALVYVELGWAANLLAAWRARTTSNALAMLTIMPSLMLLWPRWQQRRLGRPVRVGEFALLLAGVVIVHASVLPMPRGNELTLFIALYAPMPLLLWATVRFGIAGLSFALAWTTLLTIITALNGVGPLAGASPSQAVPTVQLVLAANAVPMMLLAGVLEQQRREHVSLEDAQHRNLAILRALPDQMFVLTRDGRCVQSDVHHGNQPQALTLGPGDDIHDVLPPDLARTFSRMLATVGSSEPAVIEHTYLENGTPRRIEARLIAADAGRVLTITRDITNRWRAEQELRETQHRYAIATTAGGIGVWDLHVDTGDLRVLGNLHEVLGYGDGEIPGRLDAWLSRIRQDDHDDVMARLTAVLAGESRQLDAEFRLVARDGSDRWVVAKGAITERADGRPLRLTGTYADVTERRESARLLREANDALVRMNRIAAVAEVSASITHEVNQPLTAIAATAMTGLRWTEADPASHRVHLLFQEVLEDSRRAAHVVERTHHMYSNEPAHVVDVSLNDIARKAAELIAPRSRELLVRVQMTLEEGLPAVSGDSVQLQQVLLNLIINAMDAMRTSPAHPHQLVIRSRRGTRHVFLSVRDSGPGFGPAGPAFLFEPFYTTKSEGTGMGLAIARSIVQTHGGHLWAATNHDRGVTFTLKLPRVDAPADRQRLLIVDDDRSMRRSMARLLHSWGHQVMVASEATRALALAETFNPDVAILDLAIGEDSGLDLARALRHRFPDRRTRLIAMSAEDDEEVRQACLAVFDAYLLKPGQLTDLERILRHQA